MVLSGAPVTNPTEKQREKLKAPPTQHAIAFNTAFDSSILPLRAGLSEHPEASLALSGINRLTIQEARLVS